MSAFCKKCGSALEPNSAFCDNCGAPIHSGLTQQPPTTQLNTPQADRNLDSNAIQRRPYVMSRKVLYIGSAVAVLLVAGVAASFLLFGPPAATSATLLPAYQTIFTDKLQRDSKRQLCIANLNYGQQKFNAGQNDTSTRNWMDALVLAGLYNPPVIVRGGSRYYPQTLLQYVATPELAKWRDGNRLCVAKTVQAVDVIDISKPSQEQIRFNDSSMSLVVKGKVVLQASDTANWLEKPDIRAAVLPEIPGWEYKAGKLQKEILVTFAIHDGKWVTQTELETIEERLFNAAEDAAMLVMDAIENHDGKWFSSLGEKISSLFSFGGNPLVGVWVSELPKGLTITVTNDSIENDGKIENCQFSKKDNHVTANCGQQQFVFEILAKDRIAMTQSGMQLVFKRVK